MSSANENNVQFAARQLVDSLPPNATWDDLMEKVYVRQAIERGLKSAETEELIDVEEVRRRFGLSE